MNHAAKYPCSILDGFSTSQLHIIGIEKHYVTPQFIDAGLERDASASGRLGENHGPSLVCKGLVLTAAALSLNIGSIFQNDPNGFWVHCLNA